MYQVSKEDIARARELDLRTYLETYEPFELVRVSGETYCTREHDSLRISNGMWYWFSRGFGGRSALDYLVKVRGMALPMAVDAVLGRSRAIPAEVPKKPEVKKLKLPELAESTYNAKRYLMSRGIDGEIIDWCVERGKILESKEYANAIFVGFDKNGTARYAAVRGTRGKYKGDVSGSDKRFSFSIAENTESKAVHVFEAAIDLLSYATLMKMDGLDWKEESLLSLAGVYAGEMTRTLPKALDHFLKNNPRIETVALHLDADMVGRSASLKIQGMLHDKYRVEIVPIEDGKDVNEELMIRLGLMRKDIDYER